MDSVFKNTYEHHLEFINDPLCPFKLDHHKFYPSYEINWHKSIEIILVSKGQGCIQCGSNEYEVRPGDMVLINSGVMHRIDCKGGMEFYYLIIADSFFYENGIQIDGYQFREFLQDAETEAKFREAIRYIDYKEKKDGMTVPLIRKAILEILIDICTRHVADKTNMPALQHASEKYIKQALSYISDHFTESITLEEIASFVNVSKYYLTREFKKTTGKTIFLHINTLRCVAAATHITHGMSVAEAAKVSGFDSTAHFSRTYKKIMGALPSKIQKSAAK